jgi:23S rRNA (uracil1939-C5)-methyltransferase
MNKNDIFTAEIIDYTSEGLGVCRYNGQTFFVRGAARGDIAKIRVVKTGALSGKAGTSHSNPRYAWGRVEELVEPSKMRIANDCKAFPMCGGCDLRHISYEEELFFKRNKVEQTLKRLGGAELSASDIIAAEDICGYRNKAIIPIGRHGGDVIMGYYRARSHDIVPHDECAINAPEINHCAETTRRFLRENDIQTARHLMVRAVSGGVQAALITKGNLKNSEKWVSLLRENCPNIKSIIVIENSREDNVLLSGTVKVLWGDLTIIERIGELEFELHPFAFAQVNTRQAEKLYDLAREYAGEYNVAADLYCGTGAIALWLGGKIYGVEIVPEAVECARRNAERNGITNVKFILGDAGEMRSKHLLSADGTLFFIEGKVDVVVIDPPRSGLNLAAIDTVAELAPERIVYVSCNPATLARDLKLFADKGYRADKLGIVDLFPRTRHVECVVRLIK